MVSPNYILKLSAFDCVFLTLLLMKLLRYLNQRSTGIQSSEDAYQASVLSEILEKLSKVEIAPGSDNPFMGNSPLIPVDLN